MPQRSPPQFLQSQQQVSASFPQVGLTHHLFGHCLPALQFAPQCQKEPITAHSTRDSLEHHPCPLHLGRGLECQPTNSRRQFLCQKDQRNHPEHRRQHQGSEIDVAMGATHRPPTGHPHETVRPAGSYIHSPAALATAFRAKASLATLQQKGSASKFLRPPNQALHY